MDKNILKDKPDNNSSDQLLDSERGNVLQRLRDSCVSLALKLKEKVKRKGAQN